MAETRIELRVSAEQKARITERAKQTGLSLSDYIRKSALGEVEAAKSPAPAPPPSPSTRDPSPPPAAVQPSSPAPAPAPDPPAADQGAADLEARITARATQIYGRGLTHRQAKAQALRELA